MNNKQDRYNVIVTSSLLFTSAIVYYLLSHKVQRQNFIDVITCFTFLFAGYYFIYKKTNPNYFKYLVLAGIFFRLIVLPSVPNLSEDVYRFIWDGRLAANGVNPYSMLPSEIIKLPPIKGITSELYNNLNSPDYFSIYPPVLQGLFYTGAALFSTNTFYNILFFKIIILIVEILNVFLLVKILHKKKLPKTYALLYFLNPLVIIELTGNVHFEAIMIFFLLSSFYLLELNKWKISAIALSLGIATKLLPVLFIPVIIYYLKGIRGFIYLFIASLFTLFLFFTVFDLATLKNMIASINLFFRNFEFNASIYYTVRWIGKQITGYNNIAIAGPLLAAIASIAILYVSVSKKVNSKDFPFIKALIILSIWFALSTTVHPWYTCTLVALAACTKYKFAIVWSYTATLSYIAYQTNPPQENLILISLGYLAVFGFIIFELNKSRVEKKPLIIINN